MLLRVRMDIRYLEGHSNTRVWVWHAVGVRMEMYVKTLKPSREHRGMWKAQSSPAVQQTNMRRQHAQQDISKEVSEGCCRAIETTFHLTLPREPTPPITFDLIPPLLKSVVNFLLLAVEFMTP